MDPGGLTGEVPGWLVVVGDAGEEPPVVQSFFASGLGVTPGLGEGGGTLGGGDVDPVFPNEKDHPSTVPAGGVRLPAPKLL
ncbi:MAG: hypothetical protein WBA45_10540 [Microthrixaceae bacterium]